MALNVNEHYYLDPNGLLVFTEKYHLERGYCCNNGCRHCPYRKSEKKTEKPDDNELEDEVG